MRNNNGFTLIEVMIAMVVLLIGMLGVMGMQYYAVAGNASSRELKIATTLSTEMIEQLRGTPYANLASGTDNPLSPADFLGDTASVNAIAGGMAFTRTWWVVQDCSEFGANVNNSCALGNVPVCVQTPGATATTLVTAVRVRTCWTDKNGTARSATINGTRLN